MARLKTFLIYALLIVLFFIFSEFLINVSLQAAYNDITRRDNTEQVQIQEAQATLVNGKIKGTIKNSEQDYLTGKYVKIDLYSKRDNLLGTKYIEINTTETQNTQDFSMYFELTDVESYNISIVDQKEEGELDLIPDELTKPEIWLLTAMTVLILW